METKPKNLSLSLMREFFEQIRNGEKTEEYRQITPSTMARYLLLDENKDMTLSPSEDTVLCVEYDTITFYTGQFKDKRPGIVVECLGASVVKSNRYKSKEYQPKYITYYLGKILKEINFEYLKPLKS